MSSRARLLLTVNVLVALLVIGSVWLPVVVVFKGLPSSISMEVVEGSRVYPDREAAEVADSVMTGVPLTGNLDPAAMVAAAESALRGQVSLEVFGEASIELPFDEGLVETGNTTWQLAYSGFLIPQLFLNAYQETGREEFLVAARDFILGWRSFERSLLIPRGFVWNDHAVASRGFVLARFWHHYRNHEIFRAEEAEEILRLVVTTARLLAHERLYTYRTNHGTMQDIALAKLALFFPLLDGFDEHGRLALRRAGDQMAFLFNTEGVSGEHSVGYHVFGLGLLSDLSAIAALMGGGLAEPFERKRESGLDFLRLVRRPDGSLPRVGDTLPRGPVDSTRVEVGSTAPGAPGGRPDLRQTALYPKSGYAVHRSFDGGDQRPQEPDSHLLVYWGQTPYLGHKHANELSVHLWVDGVDWWTAAGYWPYSRDDRDTAVSWTGSNAPHLVGEPLVRGRSTRLNAQAHEGSAFFLDLSREGPEGFGVRRQVLAVPGGVWVTLDALTDGSPRRARVIWMSDSPTTAEALPGEPGYRLRAKDSKDRLTAKFLGAEALSPTLRSGQAGSTIGWMATDKETVEPAAAVVLELPSKDSWLAKISVHEPGGTGRWAGSPRMISWRSPENWQLEVPLIDRTLLVARRSDEIRLEGTADETAILLDLERHPNAPQYDRRADAAFQVMQSQYGNSFRPLISYRSRVTWVLCALFVAHLGFLVLLFWVRPPLRTIGFCLPLFAWTALGAWLHGVYFP